MLIKDFQLGQLGTNCYIVTDENTLECAVIDPGDEANTVIDYLEDNNLKCRFIFLTHGHYDHTMAVMDLAAETGAKVCIHENDAKASIDNAPFTFCPPDGSILYAEGAYWMYATSSNIGYSWWSHDIGGHMKGYRDDEMQVRWLQLGVFSPILRLHSTNSDFQRKEPWCYNPEAERIMKDSLRLRHSLFPYLYTMNYRNHTQGQPLVQPMYYAHPQTENAYNVPNVYWFGSELIAAPITQPLDPVSRLAKADVWLPEGDWFDMTTGVRYTGKEDIFPVYRPLDQIPVFARAGGIVPQAKYPAQDNRLTNAEQLKLLVFPGSCNTFTLYEDAGEGYGYEQGAFATTKIQLDWGKTAVLTIEPAQGDLSLIPGKRSWEILLRGWHKNIAVAATVDGQEISCQSRYDDKTHSTHITVMAPVDKAIRLTVSGQKLINENEDKLQLCSGILQAAQTTIVTKESWMKLLKGEGTAQEKLAAMEEDCSQYGAVLDAIKEILSL